MTTNEFPEECLNDPQFMHNFIVTMCGQICSHEKIVSEGTIAVSEIKEAIAKGLEHRKMAKTMIDGERIKKSLLEPVLKNSHMMLAEQTAKLALIKAELDEDTLREKADIQRFKEVVQVYKSTWEHLQADYEVQIPLAAERRNEKAKYELAKIELMMKTQKKIDLQKSQAQKRRIDERRMQVNLLKLARLLTERKKCEVDLKSLLSEDAAIQADQRILDRQKVELLEVKKVEETMKLRARQMMPPPKLDISVLKSFHPSEQIAKRPSSVRSPSDLDTISINSAFLEEMCRPKNQEMEVAEDDRHSKISERQLLARSITMVCNNQSLQEQVSGELPEHIDILEQSCSQLSLEEDGDTTIADNSPEESLINSPIKVQAVIEASTIKNSPIRKPSSLLKAQSLNRKTETTVEKPDGLPEEKKRRVHDQKGANHAKIEEKKSSNKEGNRQSPEVPKIQSIENITRSVNISTKPPVAEVTPTHSTLFSSKTYAPSVCASIADSEMDSERDIEDMSENWRNFGGDVSPPHDQESNASFSSNASAFKLNDDKQQQSANTAFSGNNPFFSMFQGSKGAFF